MDRVAKSFSQRKILLLDVTFIQNWYLFPLWDFLVRSMRVYSVDCILSYSAFIRGVLKIVGDSVKHKKNNPERVSFQHSVLILTEDSYKLEVSCRYIILIFDYHSHELSCIS